MSDTSQPGPKSRETIERFNKYVMSNYTRLPLVAVRGEGPYIWDADGKRYLDLFSGWAVTGVGHCHPRLAEAIAKQAAKLIFMPNTWYTEPQGRLAEWIATTSFGGKCFFCNSGAEANEGAIKLARLATAKEKYKIISFENSFHGRTFAAITATAQPKYQQGFAPLVPGFSYAPLNDLEAVEKLVDGETAAILVEPIQGEGGVNVADAEFLRALRDLCDQRGMVLIFDEVQTGVGRCGTWWGYQVPGVEPDIMTMAKQLGGGTAIGAMCAKPEVAEHLKPGTHASTFGGNPLAAAAGCAVFEIIRDENLLENTQKMGAYLKQRMLELKQDSPLIAEVRGAGLMVGVELTESGAGVAAACLAKGLHINCTHGTVLRIMPPLTITREQLDEGLDVLADVLNAERGTGRQTANSKKQ
ncbi:MAG TPA: aspartate aminotransferase family protein [Phycisphaerae bacterium]|nr:aspartate aminotransferase family protein [Phycisphaerae bacterium]